MMDWFLYDNGLRYERVKRNAAYFAFWIIDDKFLLLLLYLGTRF